MVATKILQGILASIDIMDFTPQATKAGGKYTIQYTDYFQEKVKTIADRYGFQVVKSMGDIVLIFGTDVESILEIMLDLFQRDKPKGKFGFIAGLRMVAHSGYFQFQVKNHQPWDLVNAESIKVFLREKYAGPGELMVTHELYQGIKTLLTPRNIEANRMTQDKPLKGFDSEEWFPPFYKLTIVEKEIGAANLLEQRMEELARDVEYIPVFGNIYPPVPMDKNFIDLSILTHQDKTDFTNEKFYDDKEGLKRDHKRKKQKQEDEWIFIDKKEQERRQDYKEIDVNTLYENKGNCYTNGVIFGLPGAGKTTILRHLAHKELKANQRRKPNRKKLVLFVPCRDIPFYDSWHRDRYGPGTVEPDVNTALAYMTWVFLLGSKTSKAVTPGEQVEFSNAVKKVTLAFKENRLTLLVDGLDEAPDSPSKERVKELVLLLASQNRLFLTSRPSERIHLRPEKLPVFNVLSLTMDQVREVARQLMEEDSPMYKKFDEAIWQEEIVVKIAATPITALLITAYFQVYEQFDQRFPMYDLLMKFILVKVWENIKTDSFQYKNLELFFEEFKKKDFFEKYIDAGIMYDGLGSLCYRLFFKGAGGKVHRRLNEETLTRHFKEVITGAYDYNEDKTAASVTQWIERFRQDHLLLQAGAREYVFIHSTIMEYLAAYYIIQQTREDREKLPILVQTALKKEEFLGLETIPIASGNDLSKGFTILTVLRDTRVKYKKALLYELGIECLTEVEWLINNTLQAMRLEGSKKTILDFIYQNRAAFAWLYDYIKKMVLTDKKSSIKRNIGRFGNFTRLSRHTLLEEYLDYDSYYDGGMELVNLRKQLLLKLVQKQLIEAWEKKHKESRESIKNVLQLDYPGYHPGDKNFSYFKKIIGKELAGFFGSPNLVHNSSVLHCVFSPDGKNFLSSDKDGTLKLWDAGSGKEVRIFPGHDKPAWGCAFSPDGTRILSAYEDHIIKMWDVGSGKEIHTFTGHTNSVNHCIFSPDGKQILSASGDFTLKLWDAGSGKEIRTIPGHKGPVNHCAFSPDETQIISASYDNTLKLWDASSGKEIRTFPGHKGSVMGCAFSPDGTKIISASYDNTLKLWDVGSGKEIRTFSGHEEPVKGCVFSPDGTKILSASYDNTLKLWQVGSGKEILTFSSHVDDINSCAFSPDGTKILSASEDNTLKFWDAVKGKEIYFFSRHINDVDSCAFSPDGALLLSASRDATLKLWDAASGKEIRTFTGHNGPVKSCAFSPDGTKILSASEDKTLKLWDAASGKEIRTFTGHKGPVKSCTFSPEGSHILSASSDKTLKLWEANSGKEIRTFFEYEKDKNPFGHKRDVNSCAFSPDGKRFISASDDQTLKLWNVGNDRAIFTFPQLEAPANFCVFSPDGMRILSTSDKSLDLWEIESGKGIPIYPKNKKQKVIAFLGCMFSNDGKSLITTSRDKTLKLWDIESGKVIKSIQLPWIPLYVTFSPQNPTLAVTANQNGTLTMFDFSKYM